MRRLLVLPLLAAACAAAPATAHAGKIYYDCQKGKTDRICRASDAGGKGKVIAKGVFGPSVSRNGKVLVGVRDGKLAIMNGSGRVKRTVSPRASASVMLPKVNAKGTKVVWTEIQYTYYPYSSSIPFICTVAVKAGKGKCEGSYSGHAGWGPGGRVVGTVSANDNVLCTLTAKVDDTCVRKVLDEPSFSSWPGIRPEMSPNGKTLVDSYAPDVAASTTGIATYSTAGGKRKKFITRVAKDDDPVFSPSGSRVAFTRGNSIYVVGASGGKARRLIRGGSYPAWSR
jgi:hypothetical protein